MAKQTITTTPTALAGLELDVIYTVQFRSTGKTFVQAATSAPSDDTAAFVVGNNGVVSAKRTGSNQVYVWANDAGGNAVYEQAV